MVRDVVFYLVMGVALGAASAFAGYVSAPKCPCGPCVQCPAKCCK